jgi:hypothetical protein
MANAETVPLRPVMLAAEAWPTMHAPTRMASRTDFCFKSP